MRSSPLSFDDRRGNVAIMFGLTALPIMLMIGVAVDYGRMTTAHTSLQMAVDSATLDTAIYVSQQIAAGTPPTSTQVTTQYQRMLAARTSTTGQFTLASSALTYNKLATQVTIAGTAGATVVPSFGKFFGKTSYAVSASSTAAKNLLDFANISLVLDVSPSMAVAATPADIATLEAATAATPSGRCAFACHDLYSAVLPPPPPPLGSTNYEIARAKNVTLRIDVVKSAAQQLAAYIPTVQQTPQQYSIGLYTMGARLATLQTPTTNLGKISSAVAAVDFDQMSTVVPTLGLSAALSANQQLTAYADSDFKTTLASLNGIVASPGDGSAQNKRSQFVFLVTDGLSDVGNPVNWSVNTTYNYPPVPNFAVTGNDWGKTTQPLDPTWCDQFKNRGIQVAVLYVTYVPNPSDPSGDYQKGVMTNAPPAKLSSNLTACASPGLFREASDSNQVSGMLQQLFNTIATSPHLTN